MVSTKVQAHQHKMGTQYRTVARISRCCFYFLLAATVSGIGSITASYGKQTLRSLFDSKLDRGLLVQGIETYKDIQKRTTPYIQPFLDMGIPDWSLNKFPNLYQNLLNDENMSAWGMSVKNLNCLRERAGFVVNICKELDAYHLPSVLNHSDFQDNNMLVDHGSGKVTIIDWGEVSAGNPLLPLSSCLWSASRIYGLKAGSEDYKFLQACLLEGWGIPKKECTRVFFLVNSLAQIYYAFTLQELIELTGHNSQEWGNKIKSALISFMENEDGGGHVYSISSCNQT